MQTKKVQFKISFEMAEPRGTQIKNLPRVNTIDGSDVIVKQKTLENNAQTQGITVDNVISHINQQLSIPQILQDISDIQQQITTIIQKSDVADIVNCYDNEGDTSKTDIVHYDTTTLSNNDIIEVLEDETHSDSVSYYKYNATTNTFTYIGSLAPYYNKTEIDDKLLLINNDIANIYSTGLFQVWDSGKTYKNYAIVFKNNLYWRSLQDNNIGHDPEELNSEWWESFLDLTSLVNRIATLENLPHIIHSNYTTLPYYEVFSNGMCRQWSFPDPSVTASTYTTNKTFSFAIPYKNTGYLLYPIGFDVHDIGEQLVTLSTTGFTTSSLATPCGTRVWVAYGEVDLSQISNYI